MRTEGPWLPMGTRALRGNLFAPPTGPGRAELRRRKLELLASSGHEVSVTLPGVEEAASEAAQLVARASGLPLWPSPNVPSSPSLRPLEAAALLVPDDLVVLTRTGRVWRMAAGVVCFPSHWSPPEKLGLPVADVHGPVPRYHEELSERVDRFLDHLAADRPVWRRNWTVHSSPELHAPRPVRVEGTVPPGCHWLRSERQALVALPESSSILFTIGTDQVELTCLSSRPDIGARLAQAMRSTPPDLARYRFASLDIAAIATWLEGLGH